ncbi:hypothetical protein K2173_025260 [Erythroxylum novogranatense]|uniref:WRC domain-containing protein n=1 Tax=Erythroxylum novogranatense TaxID=1862640 RepID=A0AAV8UDF8_9ROSI|nr:hypothetical protein K2173_025260 [Erythroxylum novogranatense]
MRIRKNANLSSLVLSSHAPGSEVLQTHVCQLNQSPWDVISFSSDAHPSSLPQFEGEDSFNGNVSLGDSIGAVESVASMMVDAEEKASIKMKIDNMVIDDNYEMEGNPLKKGMVDDDQDIKAVKRSGKIHCCNKNDGKGWHCKNEPKEGYSMCQHHLSLLKSYSSNIAASSLGLSSVKKPEKTVSGSRRGRAKSAKKGSSSTSTTTSNPYAFYYYSGFGPSWGKRRGEVNKIEAAKYMESNTNTAFIGNTTPSSSSSPIEHNTSDRFEYEDEDDDDEEELEDNENGGDSGKKRMRKPVKARSLKSLM